VAATSEAQMIIPCSLQLLVENAIKHNSFSESDPLLIHINIQDGTVSVENSVRSKPYIMPGTGTGLAHLHQHYRLVCNKDIVIEKNNQRFIVTVPLIKQQGI
jgi:two-component system LytT family sensor kinase